MKKIILTLGLSTLLTMSNLSASDLTISEPLADEPLTVENRFEGFYIKPFAGISGMSISGKVSSKKVDVPSIANTKSKDLVRSSFYETKTKVNFIGGIAVGKHLNEYIGIESSIGYYHSNYFSSTYTLRFTPDNNKSFETRYYSVNTNYLGIINAILSPVINANITENISLYFTAGIGASYIMFSNDIKNWHAFIGNSLQEPDNSEAKHYNNAQKVHLSWAVGAGVLISLTKSTELDIGYSYKSLGKLPTSFGYQKRAKKVGVSVLESMPLLVHEVRVGVKFNF